jgi:hypothetical protein
MDHPHSSNSSFVPQDYAQQHSESSQGIGELQEDIYFPVDSGLQFPPFSHDQGNIFLSEQTIQPYFPDHVLVQDSFTEGGMLQPMYAIMPIAEAESYSPLASGGIGEVDVQSMAPPAAQSRKRKAPTLRNEDWEPIKTRVIDLHIAQRLPLPRVKEMVEQEFKSTGFTAT